MLRTRTLRFRQKSLGHAAKHTSVLLLSDAVQPSTRMLLLHIYTLNWSEPERASLADVHLPYLFGLQMLTYFPTGLHAYCRTLPPVDTQDASMWILSCRIKLTLMPQTTHNTKQGSYCFLLGRRRRVGGLHGSWMSSW